LWTYFSSDEAILSGKKAAESLLQRNHPMPVASRQVQ